MGLNDGGRSVKIGVSWLTQGGHLQHPSSSGVAYQHASSPKPRASKTQYNRQRSGTRSRRKRETGWSFPPTPEYRGGRPQNAPGTNPRLPRFSLVTGSHLGSSGFKPPRLYDCGHRLCSRHVNAPPGLGLYCITTARK